MPTTRIASTHTNVPLDWADLQAFLAVCELGAIARAADQLGVGHATVLRRLGALESRLGSTLLRRNSRGYEPTAAGHALRINLGGMAERLQDTWASVQGVDTALRGSLRLTTTDTLLQGLLGPHLDRFCAENEGIRLDVVVRNQFLSLARRDADVAVRGSNDPPDNLVGRFVGLIQTAPFASRNYLKGKSRRALDELDWIAPHDGLAHLEQAKWLRRHIPGERVVMRLDSLVHMAHAVAQGVGAGMLLLPLARRYPDLVQLAEPAPALDTQIWVLSHPDLRQVARVRALVQFLYERLSADPALVHRGRPA